MIIEKMVAGGYGLGRKEGKIHLVKGAYVGEDVETEIEKQTKDVVFCTVKKINTPSRQRQIPVCAHFGSCGGCEWMDIRYETQLLYKKEIFADQMAHMAKIILKDINIIPTSMYFYRNKVEFAVNSGKIGYFGKKSHDFVRIDKCHIIDESLNSVKFNLDDKALDGFDHIVLREGKGKTMAIFISKSPQKIPDSGADEIFSLVNRSETVINGSQKAIKGKGYIETEEGGIKYRISPKSFFQVNYEGASILAEKVVEYAGKGKDAVDLYCGVGFFSLQIAKNFDRVTGVENSTSSVIEARVNAKINDIKNAEFILSKTSDFQFSHPDVIIADPPRRGIDNDTMNAILKVYPKRFVYVSCDATTFARDSYKLVQKGYKIKDVVLVDLFPQTHHFEIVSLFEREEV